MVNNTEFEFGPKQTKWLEALESGDYKQATGTLKLDNEEYVGYCCLGVAVLVCELHELSGVNLSSSYREMGLRSPDGTPLEELLRPLIPNESNGIVESGNLTNLNDTGMTFQDIAKLLRAKPEEYFSVSV